jgi:hypothetical protein
VITDSQRYLLGTARTAPHHLPWSTLLSVETRIPARTAHQHEMIHESVYRGLVISPDLHTLRTGRSYRHKRSRAHNREGALKQSTNMKSIHQRPELISTPALNPGTRRRLTYRRRGFAPAFGNMIAVRRFVKPIPVGFLATNLTLGLDLLVRARRRG